MKQRQTDNFIEYIADDNFIFERISDGYKTKVIIAPVDIDIKKLYNEVEQPKEEEEL